ncbi:MAG: restriction endonuclease subunit S [Deltaproteobacteria bacterium]|nr:restriction endonuclease subunit S [Deltaproteobacteria bacterium]
MSLLSIRSKIKIPSDWEMVPIGKVLISSQYGTSNGNSETGVPVVGMKNLQDGKVNFNDLPFVSLDEEERKRLILHNGDILLNRTNSYDLVGKIGFVENACEAVFASYLIRLEMDKTKSDPKFVAMWLSSFWADQMIKKIATRAVSQANVNPTEFKKFCLIPLPPLPEQKAIADLLSTWDEAIEKTERLIQAKEKWFKGLTQNLISKRCDSWPHIKSKKIFDTITEKNFPDEELLSVTQDRGVIPRSMLEGRVMSPNGTTANYKLIKRGDFAISLRSFQGGIEYSNYQGIISPAYTVLRPKIELNNDFYRLFFKSYIFIEKHLNLAVIGIRDGKQISIPDFLSIKIPVPPLEEQKEITETLSIFQQEIDLLKQLSEKYKTQKRGLMQKILTGEWRVKPEIIKKYEGEQK